MAASEIPNTSPPLTPENAEKNLQPFFVLRTGKSDRKSTGKTRTKSDIFQLPSTCKSEKMERKRADEEHDDNKFQRLHMEAFAFVWSKIESAVKDILRKISTRVFDDINGWVQESFNEIRSCGTPVFVDATRFHPIVTETIKKQLFTGLVCTKNIEHVDDILTFEELSLHLKSHGCHVANLSFLDFSAKNGIGGCLRSLLRQFLAVTIDAADISILASWFSEERNNDNPVVIIIDGLERCCGSVLSDFVLMLSEWAIKIPIILIMGVATTLDTPRNILPSNALQKLRLFKFMLESPAERMDAIVEAVFVKQRFFFSVGHKVAIFLRNYFLRQDGTLTAFIRALKIACVEHFSEEPLSYVINALLAEEDGQGLWHVQDASLPKSVLKYAFTLPSYDRTKRFKESVETLAHGLLELKRSQISWSKVTLCLYEAGKYHKISMLDLLCEALDPSSYTSRADGHHKNGFIYQAVCKVRDLPAASLCRLLEKWERLTLDINEIHDKVKELQSLMNFESRKCLNHDLMNISKKNASRRHLDIESDPKALNERSAELMECMIRDYMLPIECLPFHEIVCFKNVEKLRSALIGDPRRIIQVDLLESYKFLQCSCCRLSNNMIVPSMHDTSIMYTLAQEHGDLINLHDWYQSFKATFQNSARKIHKLRQSPLTKKRKDITDESQSKSEVSLQARFCKAVIELQITGLLRMPTKRRPDYVQRVAFGL